MYIKCYSMWMGKATGWDNLPHSPTQVACAGD